MLINPLSEANKLLIARNRDEKVFKAYFVDNYNALKRYAFSLLKDDHFAEDVASEVLWKIWHLGPDLIHIAHVEHYIFRSIRNKCLNLLRVKKMTYHDNGDLQDERMEEANPERIMISKESLLKIAAAVAALPPKTNQVFKLVKEQGCSYKEVAQLMGISTNTVDRHIQIALRKLWAALKNDTTP